MTERAYTVAEIDDLRDACKWRFWYGTTYLREGVDWSADGKHYRVARNATSQEAVIATEELVRTFMLAGITAPEIRAEDERRGNK